MAIGSLLSPGCPKLTDYHRKNPDQVIMNWECQHVPVCYITYRIILVSQVPHFIYGMFIYFILKQSIGTANKETTSD